MAQKKKGGKMVGKIVKTAVSVYCVSRWPVALSRPTC